LDVVVSSSTSLLLLDIRYTKDPKLRRANLGPIPTCLGAVEIQQLTHLKVPSLNLSFISIG